ncbi:MAG: hypothetical protein LBH87_01195 [Coriobacteriales bacterium]|nr:hypothetical protein [Coriobacteriales bacterium]
MKNTATLEDVSSIVQNIKKRARGFRNLDYFKVMIYLSCSDLDLTTVPT